MSQGSVAAPVWKPRFNPWVIALTVTMATFMEVLDSSIANVSLSHIAGSLSAGQDESTWVLTSYLVSNAVVLPLSGWLATVIGRKRFYMSCVALFTASSILCGFSPSLGWLIFFRVLQGAGGGGMGPSEQAILADTFAPEKRGQAFAMYGMAVVVAPAIGPTLGGWITDNYDWRWIFFINVPVGILSLIMTNRVVEDPPHLRGRRGQKFSVDYIGLALLAVGIGFLQVVLDKGQEDDWFGSKFITTFFIVAITCLVALVIWEWNHKDPIMEISLLKNRNFAASFFFNFILGLVLYGTTVLIPQFLQLLMGYSAQQAGMALSPGGFFMMFMMPLAGFLVSKFDPRKLIMFGFGIMSLALYHMTNLNLQLDFKTFVWWRIFQVAGLAFIFIPISTLSYVGIPMTKNNQISGMSNFIRNLGGSVGISLLTTFLARQSQTHQNNMVAHATPYDAAFRNMLNGAIASMRAAGSGPALAVQQGYTQVMGTIQQQAMTLAYVNAFFIVAVLVGCLVPLPLLLKRPRAGAEAPPAGH
jgi:MFS transporter, DHA2 family, multidrug resistance protein